jgi:hypothetical protein
MNNISDKLLINLRIISKIQKNGRISRSNDGIIFLETNSFYKSLKRFISSDSRKQSLFEINSVISECISTITNIINSKYMNPYPVNRNNLNLSKSVDNVNLLSSELTCTQTGIENLKFTYRRDQNTVSQLDIILMKIKTALQDTETLLTQNTHVKDVVINI